MDTVIAPARDRRPPVLPDEVIAIYRRRARRYDFTANLYYLAGFREQAYRERAVAALDLHRGDRVLEIGCGTGLNFPLLERAIGPEGRLVGVDVTDAMLDRARSRVARHAWTNVELVCADAADYAPPLELGGAISSFAISLSPRADEIVATVAHALRPGGRLVVLDLKAPPPPLARLVPWLLPLVRPFAVDAHHLAERPWERIWGAMFRELDNVRIDEGFGGLVYLASGRKPLEAG